jgi:hypothetical protein
MNISSRHYSSTTVAPRRCSITRSFTFPPPTTRTELSRIHPELTPLCSSPVTAQPSAAPQRLRTANATVLHSNSVATHHSIVTLQYVRAQSGRAGNLQCNGVLPRTGAPTQLAEPERAKRFTHTVYMLYALSDFVDQRFSRYTIICYSIVRWPSNNRR